MSGSVEPRARSPRPRSPLVMHFGRMRTITSGRSKGVQLCRSQVPALSSLLWRPSRSAKKVTVHGSTPLSTQCRHPNVADWSGPAWCCAPQATASKRAAEPRSRPTHLVHPAPPFRRDASRAPHGTVIRTIGTMGRRRNRTRRTNHRCSCRAGRRQRPRALRPPVTPAQAHSAGRLRHAAAAAGRVDP
jgi:hypothetical protein